MPAVGIATLLLLAASPVRVVGEGCPAGAAVGEALAPMLVWSSDPATPDVAKVGRAQGKLRIELVDAEGVVIAKRVLDANGSCAELAKLAAIVIASWESDVHPQFVRPHSEWPPAAQTASRPAPVAYEVVLGLSLGWAGALAAGGVLGGWWFPRGLGLGLGLVGRGEATRTLEVGTHQARWRRWTGSLELAWRWGGRGVVLDAHAGATAGWLAARGVDFEENAADAAVSLAGVAGTRLLWWAHRRVATWFDVQAFCFTREESVWSRSGGEARIPQWGMSASVGMAFGRSPDSP